MIQPDEHFVQLRWRLPLRVCAAAVCCGVLLGMVSNSIDGLISRDYFAIVMSWDWQAAPFLAVLQGAIEGAVLGLFFGVFFVIVLAASTGLRCRPGLALRGLALALLIVISCWIIGGITGAVLARIEPRLWGFFFVGVPPRVNLPRFAWVGGSIWGAYAGTAIGLTTSAVYIHFAWRRITGRVRGFAVVAESSESASSGDVPRDG